MELGSKEWFEALEKNVKFPATIAFYVSNLGKVYSRVVDTKADVSNIRYSKIHPTRLSSNEHTALVKVEELLDSNDYLEATKYLQKVWNSK